MRIVTLALLVLFLVPAWASEPGEPLDCSDMLFLSPGLVCSTWVPFPCTGGWERPGRMCFGTGTSAAFDNEGWLYYVENVSDHHAGPCGSLGRVVVFRYNGVTDEDIAYIDERCIDGTAKDAVDHFSSQVDFDDKSGRLIVHLWSGCSSPETCPYGQGQWVAAIEGFTTTFEVLHSYTPTTSQIGVRVPFMPEGFDAADWFDTYYGDLARVGDWNQAQPLQCGYPATAPSVGDYLTVDDTLPTPSPGGASTTSPQ